MLTVACYFRYMKAVMKAPDPVVAQIRPAKYLGAVTEKFQNLVDEFIKENRGKV